MERTLSGLLPEVVALRRNLHQQPEIRYQETATSDRIASFLSNNGVLCRRGLAGGTGILACVEGRRKGRKPPKTILFRADMDALEISEETGLPYASKVADRMHACGHDAHMAMLCGAAVLLARHLDEFSNIRVLFAFQPAEEGGAGGRKMVEEGILEGVSAAFGLHVWPEIPMGRIASKPGPMMAAADKFEITVHGRGTHGAAPSLGTDPVVVAAHVVTALQSLISREKDPVAAGVVSVGSIHAGKAYNVIPDTARLGGTIRAVDDSVFDALRKGVVRVARKTAEAFGAKASVKLGHAQYPPLHNDVHAVKYARRALGEPFMELQHPSMAAEDFAYYTRAVPGAMLWLGHTPPDGLTPEPLHSARFCFNDDLVAPGIRVWAQLAREFNTWEA